MTNSNNQWYNKNSGLAAFRISFKLIISPALAESLETLKPPPLLMRKNQIPLPLKSNYFPLFKYFE